MLVFFFLIPMPSITRSEEVFVGVGWAACGAKTSKKLNRKRTTPGLSGDQEVWGLNVREKETHLYTYSMNDKSSACDSAKVPNGPNKSREAAL